MKNLKLTLFMLLLSLSSTAQFSTRNGHILPPEDTIRVLFLYAEVDCSACPGSDKCLSTDNADWWLPGQLPNDVENYIDATIAPGQEPQKPITRYFKEASFGKYIVLGDYYDEILTISCNSLIPNQYASTAVFNALQAQYDNNNAAFATTHNGLTLADFDLISDEGDKGAVKSLTSNGVIDVIGIIWRNNGSLGGCESGAAYQVRDDILPWFTLNDGTGNFDTKAVASYNDCKQRRKMFYAEFFHALYGGNHWHTGGGPGQHTFAWPPASIGLSGQANSLSSAVCGWDRWMIGWPSTYDDPNNTLLPAALNASGTLVDTDLKVPNANEQIYILRDHVTTGDALRITLPHFNWQEVYDVKNQYLWIENRQHISDFDVQQYQPADVPCPDDFEIWRSGMYPSVVVGKDVLENDMSSFLFTNSCQNPNGCGSHQFPLSAEGHYDFKYRIDLENQENNDNWCAGKFYVPKEKEHPNTLPNPFTGASDLYPVEFDYGGDGALSGFDKGIDASKAEVIDGEVVLNLNLHGDADDAFRLDGNSKIGIGTNPSSAAIYTHYSSAANAVEYDNRTIWLNGISVEILEEIWNNDLQAYDIKVKVRWDDYLIDEDQRWCGNIVSQDDPNDSWQAQVVLGEGKKLILDQGRSPIYSYFKSLPDGTPTVTEPTILKISAGTKLHMLENSNLTIKKGSTLLIEDGAEVVLENGACIVVEEDGFLELEGNNIQINGPDALISVRGTMRTADNVDFTFMGDGYVDFYENHVLEMGAGSNFILKRDEGDPGYGERFVLLRDNTTLSIDDRLLSLQGGAVFFENFAKLRSTNADISFTETTFTDLDDPFISSNNNSIGFEGNNLLSCMIDDCTFERFELGLQLSGNTTIPNISNSRLTHNLKGAEIMDMDEVNLVNNTVTLNSQEGMRIEQVDVVNFGGGWFESNPLGLRLTEVNFAYLAGTHLSKSSDKALHAHESNVFLNDGGAVFESNIGVYFSKSLTTTDWYMLSVGKCNCAKIVDNNIGIQGDDIILDIDQIEHSFECTPAEVSPNRFDGNGQIFDICYSLQFVTPILMRGNYWGGQGLGNNYSMVYGDGFLCNLGNVAVDALPFASTYEICGDFSGFIDPNTPTTADVTKVACEITSGGSTVAIHEQSRHAFYDLFQKDYRAAEMKYTPVASLDPTTNTNASCVNKIHIARCIVDAVANDQYSSPRADWVPSATANEALQTKEVAIYPNPTKSSFTIEHPSQDEQLVNMYNIYGQLVTSFVFQKKREMDVSYLAKGIYILEIVNGQKSKVQTQKLIVE